LQKLRRLTCLLCAVVIIFCNARHVFGQMVPASHIREDQTWRGEVLIRRQVIISAATVRVEPGTTICFAGRSPEIQLGSPMMIDSVETPAPRLILAGSAEKPVVLESTQGQTPGIITTSPTSHGSIIAQHAIFRRLGKPLEGARFRPAIEVQLVGRYDDLWLRDCRFEECGPVKASFYSAGCGAEVADCDFVKTCGDVALNFSGGGSGIKVISGNRADAAFRISCPQILLQENVLIGEKAAITVNALSKKAISIQRNYVHCTTKTDTGRYALKCDAASASLRGNVLKGGTYCVAAAPQEVWGNVLIGVAGLKARFNVPELRVQELKSTTTTHYLLTGLCSETVVRDNLFLGPAYAGLATAGQAGKLRIEHTLFDGGGQAKRAIYFNVIEGEPLHGQLKHNVFTRCEQIPVFDHAGSAKTLDRVGDNVFAGFDGPIYENIQSVKEDSAPGDQRVDNFKQLRLGLAVSTQIADKAEQRLVRGELSVQKVRDMWFNAYRPTAHSPLLSGEVPIGPQMLLKSRTDDK